MNHPHRTAANIFFTLSTLPILGIYILYFSKSLTITEVWGLLACSMLLVLMCKKFEETMADYMSPQLVEPLIIIKLLSYILLCKVLINLISPGWGWWILSTLAGVIAIAIEIYGPPLRRGRDN